MDHATVVTGLVRAHVVGLVHNDDPSVWFPGQDLARYGQAEDASAHDYPVVSG